MRTAPLLVVSAFLFTGCVESSISFTDDDGGVTGDVSTDGQTTDPDAGDAGDEADAGCPMTVPAVGMCYVGGDCSLPVEPVISTDGCGSVCPDSAVEECSAPCEVATDCVLEFEGCCEPCDGTGEVYLRSTDQSDHFDGYCAEMGECTQCPRPPQSAYERFVPTCDGITCGKAALVRTCGSDFDCMAVCLDGGAPQAVSTRLIDSLSDYYDSATCETDPYVVCDIEGGVGQCTLVGF